MSQERFRSLENKLSFYEGHKGFPTATMLKQLLNAGLADKIGVSAEELETAWREARQALAEAKKMAKTARTLVHGEAIALELTYHSRRTTRNRGTTRCSQRS